MEYDARHRSNALGVRVCETDNLQIVFTVRVPFTKCSFIKKAVK